MAAAPCPQDPARAPATQGALRRALLDAWQRSFPLVSAPFAHIAATLGSDEATVLDEFALLQDQGWVSRIGAVWGAGAGGAALLCAFAVPAARLAEVAARVSCEANVNHNYEREHDWNLWFVVTGTDRAAVAATVDRLEACTGLRALRLGMLRAYRIDLGFELFGNGAPATGPWRRCSKPGFRSSRGPTTSGPRRSGGRAMRCWPCSRAGSAKARCAATA